MLSNDRKRITLMNPVRVNRTMKKHNKTNDSEYSTYLNQNFVTMSDSWNDSTGDSWDGVPFEIQRRFRKKWKQNLAEAYIKTRMFFIKTFGENKKSNEEFFDMVKSNMNNLEEFTAEEELSIKQELELLFRTKQKIICDKINIELHIKQYENTLISAGLKQYQEESDIINFIMKTKAGLCLTEIEYFKYDIPSDVKEKLFAADDLKVFDNFYILYMDPEYDNSKVKFTKEEKDPILFGVIKDSTKLYYIADWVTDYCQLTYDVLLKFNEDKKLKFNKTL